MASAASVASRLQRRAPDERVGDILSDSNSEVSSINSDGDGDGDGDGDDVGDRRGNRKRQATHAPVSRRAASSASASVSASEDGDAPNHRTHETNDTGANAITAARVHQQPAAMRAIKRKNSKWYDSDDDDDWNHVVSDGEKAMTAAAERSRSRSAAASERAQAHTNQPAVLSPNGSQTKGGVLSPETVTPVAGTKQPQDKRLSFQRLVGKTFNLSPFSSKRKNLDVASPASSGPDTPSHSNAATLAPDAVAGARLRSPMSDGSSVGEPAPSVRSTGSERRLTAVASGRKMSHDPHGVLSDQTIGSDVVSPLGGQRSSPAAATGDSKSSRRRSNMVQSPGVGDDATAARRGSDLPAGVGAGGGDALSPGQRKVPGAFPGRPDSGVLLEGWLRQKQRRGVKGMKKWNSRYFVLYAKSNEVRYYADVVQSAWGPLPLGEIGCISLRLIQRIGKPGTVKYKGCRLDITCRNTWGTHYADDYVSSDDENSNNNYRSADKSNSTPKSSRVYSLMADSPQIAGAWFSTLDSLLVRSANSPRVDVAPSSASSSSAKQLKRAGSTVGASAAATAKMMTRRRSSALDTETIIVSSPSDHVPKPVLYAINFIFDSSPGIETEKFYEREPEPSKLKSALKFLNQFATDAKRKPSKEDLEQALDAVTSGAVVKLWLSQLEQPIVPFEMFDDFRALAVEAKNAPFELSRHLKALVRALPPRNFAMLACVLFHLNDVNVYASKNGMDAATLASLFGEFIVRARAGGSNNQEDAESENRLLRVVVEEMIAHVDTIIDEKEAEILDHV